MHSKLPVGVNQKDGIHQNKVYERLVSDRDSRKVIHCLHVLRETLHLLSFKKKKKKKKIVV